MASASRRSPARRPEKPTALTETPAQPTVPAAGWLACAAIIAIACAIAYSNVLRAPFFLDDHPSVIENESIRDLAGFLADPFPREESPVSNRPLVGLTLALNYAIHGMDVVGYRVVNVAVHMLASITVFVVLRRVFAFPRMPEWMGGSATLLAFAVALVWSVHPLNSESVSYVTQRTESMMGLFFLLTIYAAIRALPAERTIRPTSAAGLKTGPTYTAGLKTGPTYTAGLKTGPTSETRRGRVWAGVAILACALGMASKETMAVAPLIVILFDRVFVFESWRDAFRRRRWLYVGLGATWAVLVIILTQAPRYRSAGFSSDTTVWNYLLNQTVMITRYLKLSLWPNDLVIVYGWSLPLTLGDVVPYAIFVVSMLALTVVALVRRPRVGFLGAWFFITLAPASSVIPIATEVGAERRMYLPLVAIVALVVLTVVGGWRRFIERGGHASSVRRFATVAGAVTLAFMSMGLTAMTRVRNAEYASSLFLAQTTLERWPTSFVHALLAEELLFADRRDEALVHLRQAVPGSPRSYYTLGVELHRRGQRDEALTALQEFIRRQPLLLEVPSAHVIIGKIYAEEGRWREAYEQARLAMFKQPSNLDAHKLLADALLRQGMYTEAATEYQKLLARSGDEPMALVNLGISYIALQRLDDAVLVFRRAVAAAPDDGNARKSLAMALIDSGALDEGMAHAREALLLLPRDPVIHDTLGLALAHQGRTDEARQHFEQALAIDPSFSDAREHLEAVRASRSRADGRGVR